VLALVLVRPEALSATEVWWPEPDYPAADAASAPAWLTSQKLCFSRWDGGPIETCKGVLSGWTYFNPPWPQVLDATTRWYDEESVDLAEAMGYNFLWLTLSVGFAVEQERGQWERLRPYVEACHDRGIRVAAYMSLTNLFVDGMFLHVPESRTWLLLGEDKQAVPYGAAAYEKMGRTTRMLADVSRPAWRAYLKRRVDAAIDLGFDAIEYDNNFFRIGGDERAQKRYATFLEKNGFADHPDTRRVYEQAQVRRTYRELLAHARQRKPDIVIFCNAHWGGMHISRSNTIIATEDGVEPGYYDPERTSEYERTERDELVPPLYEDLPSEGAPEMPDVQHFHVNLALLRGLKGLSEGWKPVLVEYGGRRSGGRFVNQMPPLAFQLAVGECNAALCTLQGFQEGRALLDLYRREPEVMRIVQAAKQAHDFVREHAQYVLGARYKANLGIVLDDRMRGLTLMRRLVKRNVQYQVLFDKDVGLDRLRRLRRVLVYDAKLISQQAVAGLVAYARSGGNLMVYGDSGAMDVWGQPRHENVLATGQAWATCRGKEAEAAVLAFATAEAQPAFQVLNNPYVRFTLTEKPGESGFCAHLLNYLKFPLDNVRISCAGAQQPRLLSLTPECDGIVRGGSQGEWLIPRLGVYSIVVAK